MAETFITNIFTLDGFINIVQWLVVAAEFVYLLFAFILTREVSLMNSSLKTKASALFTLLAYGHLVVTVLLILLSLTLI